MGTKPAIDVDVRTAEICAEEMKRLQEADQPITVIGSEEERDLLPYTDGRLYDHKRLMDEIRFYMNRTVGGIIETGKRLMALKGKEKGHFYKDLEELGISPMTAWRFMTVAKKLANLSRIKHLKLLDINSGIGKLYAFLDIPDDELKELEETGELRGLTLDEIDSLPVKELKNRLRKRDKQIDQGVLQLQYATEREKALQSELYKIQNPVIYSSEEEKWLTKIRELRVKFDLLIFDTMPIPISQDMESIVRNLYFLLLWMSWISSDELQKMRTKYKWLDECSWETQPDEIPAIFQDIAKVIESAAKVAARKEAKKE
jgi:hypothetical protein